MLGAARVLEAARRADAGRVILSSTVWVYAATHGDVVDEDTPFDLETDRHLYVSEKIAAEMFCARLRDPVRPPVHRAALRHPVRAAHAQRPRRRRVHRCGRMRGEPLRIDGDGSRSARSSTSKISPPRTCSRSSRSPATARTTSRPTSRSRSASSPRRSAHLVGDVEVTFGPPRPGDYRAKRVSSDRARDELGWVPRFDSPRVSQDARLVSEPMTGTRSIPRRASWVRRAPLAAHRGRPRVQRGADGRGGARRALPARRRAGRRRRRLDRRHPRARSNAGCRGHDRCQLLVHEVNQGMSEAYFLALTDAARALARAASSTPTTSCSRSTPTASTTSRCSTSSSSITIDEGLDANLARRDLSYHGAYKRSATGWSAAGRASGPAAGCTTSSRATASSGSGSLAHALDFYSGLPVQRDRRSRGRAVPARLPRAQRPRRAGARRPVAHALRDAVIDLAVIPSRRPVWRDEPAATTCLRARRRRPRRGVLGARGAARDRPRPRLRRRRRAARRAWPPRSRRPRRRAGRAAATLAAARTAPRRRRRVAGAAAARRRRARSRSSRVFTAGAALAAPRGPPARSRWVLGGSSPFSSCSRSRDAAGRAAGPRRHRRRRRGRVRGRGRVAAPPEHRARTFAFGATLLVVTLGDDRVLRCEHGAAQWFGGGVTHGPRDSGEVAITFDDAPDSRRHAAAHARPRRRARAGPRSSSSAKALVHAPQPRARHDAARASRGEPLLPPRPVALARPALPRARARAAGVRRRSSGRARRGSARRNGDRTPFMAHVVQEHGMRMAMWDVSPRRLGRDAARRSPNACSPTAQRLDHRPARRHRRRVGDAKAPHSCTRSR